MGGIEGKERIRSMMMLGEKVMSVKKKSASHAKQQQLTRVKETEL